MRNREARAPRQARNAIQAASVDDPRAANPGKVQHERWQRLAPLLQLASPLERVPAQALTCPALCPKTSSCPPCQEA